jgi:hypothetical protein
MMKRAPIQPPRRKAGDADAKQRIQDALAQIERGEYGLTAEAVVEAARDAKSPLHALIDWDLQRAAYQHWVVQAREIICTYRVKTITTTTTYKVPYYVRNPKAPADQQGYVTVDELRTDEDLKRAHVDAELSRARSALDRARGYALTLGLASEIDGLIERIVGLRTWFDDRNAA